MIANAVAYLTPIIGILIISGLVLARNRTSFFKLFASVTILIAVWLFFQYLTTVFLNTNNALLILQIATTIPNFLVIAFLQFCLFYAGKPLSATRLILVSIPAALITPLSFTGLIIQSIKPSGSSFESTVGPLYNLQTAFLFLYFLFALFAVVRFYKKSIGLQRTQSGLILLSFLIPIVILFFTNVVFVESAVAQLISPTSFLIMVAIQAYAIVKHKLFDIRLIVARSLGYILTFGTLTGIYVFAIFGVSTTLLGSSKLTTLQQLFYFVGTLVFGFTLQPLRKFFNKLTNRLFYRDAYDAQDLLDKLNKILVGNIDIQQLLRQTSEILESTLKSEYAAFVIGEVEGASRRVIGSKKVELDDEQIVGLPKHTKGMPMIIVADELDETSSIVKNILTKNKVSVLARLIPTGKDANVLGYLVLGSKKSGNPYNKQDLQVLDIIANELVIAVQNAMRFEEIEAFTVTLQEKVNDATRQLRRTNEKLKALDETKDEFISMASHQLRTPLTAVKGYVSMVVEGDAGKLNKQQKELLDQAFMSSQRMVYLIADLLNVSRLRTGKFVIENKLTNLADVVEAEIEQLKQAAAGKNQTLTYSKPAKFIDLMLDETKMRQVIMNFTDNALHYTPKDGHINVSLQDLGNSIEFTVVDDGLGVPKSEQHNLFTKFFRANNARRARPDGTGLGLFMAKKVVVAQGGAIIFSSQEGKGSTFGFTLPKNSTLLPNAVLEPKTDSKIVKK